MEVDEIHRKFPRISNGSGKLGHKMDDQYPEEEDDGEKNKRAAAAAADLGGGLGRFYGWPSSRIVRVSRASGGKDRHSKVLTSKGLRDRRVRLSVNTAIQFYDLQDRLGYDQPSKAVEWLLKAATASIAELPPITTPFPDTPRQLSDEKRSSTAGSDHLCFDSAEVDMDPKFSQPPQATKSSGAACSSTSETSKGSGLSLSRSESRIKARERAKGRVAEKEKESESSHVAGSLNPISQTTSFTELLSGGINSANHQNHNNNNNNNNNDSNNDGNNTNEANFFLKSHSPRHWSSTPMDYFASGLLGARSGLAGNPFTFGVAADHHQSELHQNFSFLSDLGNHHHNHNNHQHHNGEYNLNFTISSSSAENSSGLAGFNRGTLQSNSAPPQLPQFQRYNNNPDGSTQGFYIGTAASVENHHHQFQSGYDSRLQLCYGDAHGNTTTTTNNNNGSRHSGQKGKGRN